MLRYGASFPLPLTSLSLAQNGAQGGNLFVEPLPIA